MNKHPGGLSYLGSGQHRCISGMYNVLLFHREQCSMYSAANSSCMYYEIYGFKRNSNGLLVSAGGEYPRPAPDGVEGYVPDLLAADPALTTLLFSSSLPTRPIRRQELPQSSPLQQTPAVCPARPAPTPTCPNPDRELLRTCRQDASPSGKLVAVAGKEGLQVFHFNGASPVTRFTGLLTSTPINQMFWDNSNHLYAISQSGGKILRVHHHPGRAYKAPGSPYSINSPVSLIVRSLVP